MFVCMGRVPSKLDFLVRVHELAQDAAASKRRVVEAMALARAAGATTEEIAAASGLSVQAVLAYLDRYDRESLEAASPNAPLRADRVGTPPDPRRVRDGPGLAPM
jgi:hypothetical protein